MAGAPLNKDQLLNDVVGGVLALRPLYCCKGICWCQVPSKGQPTNFGLVHVFGATHGSHLTVDVHDQSLSQAKHVHRP